MQGNSLVSIKLVKGTLLLLLTLCFISLACKLLDVTDGQEAFEKANLCVKMRSDCLLAQLGSPAKISNLVGSVGNANLIHPGCDATWTYYAETRRVVACVDRHDFVVRVEVLGSD